MAWEPLIELTRSAFQSEKPQIVRCGPSDSSHSYGRGSQHARCGFSGETLRDRPVRALRCVSARLFGTTKPHSPKPQRSIPHRPVAPAQSDTEVPLVRAGRAELAPFGRSDMRRVFSARPCASRHHRGRWVAATVWAHVASVARVSEAHPGFVPGSACGPGCALRAYPGYKIERQVQLIEDHRGR